MTWSIITETYTWLRYHVGYAQAERWLRETAQLQGRGSLEVIYPTAAMEHEIHHILRRFQDHDLSYVDALSIHIATSQSGIDAIFAFDHHLALAGIPLLPGPLSAKTR